VENGLVTVEKHALIIDPAVWVFAGFVLFVVIMVTITFIRRMKSKQSKSNVT
jgi:hypothetical protein